MSIKLSMRVPLPVALIGRYHNSGTTHFAYLFSRYE